MSVSHKMFALWAVYMASFQSALLLWLAMLTLLASLVSPLPFPWHVIHGALVRLVTEGPTPFLIVGLDELIVFGLFYIVLSIYLPFVALLHALCFLYLSCVASIRASLPCLPVNSAS